MTSVGLNIGSATDPTSDVGTIWKAAIERYEKTTKVKLSSLSRTSNMDQILAEIQKRQERFERHRHDGSKLDKIRTLVKSSLDPIEKLGDIVAQATKAIYPPSEAIFAAVRYLISVANGVSTRYDKIAQFFEDLNAYLNQLKILECNIPPIPELKVALTEVFTSVLVLCGICAKYIQTNRIVMVFRSLVSVEDNELKAAYDQFHTMVLREQGIVRNAILVRVEQVNVNTSAMHADVKEDLAVGRRIDHATKTLLTETANIHKSIESQETTLQRESVLNWLSLLAFHEKQRTTFAKHQKGTGQWLLDTHKFRQWFLGEHNSILWCPGIPGAGKTVMASMAIDYVEENTQRSKVAIAYVYCDYKDPKTRSEIELLSSITRQLVEQIKPIPPEVSEFRDKYAEKRRYPTDDERISLLRTVSQLFERTYVFVDALDECAETNRNSFLLLAKKMEPFVRFFITSRPNLDLQKRFTNISQLEIVARGSDIRTYLESEIHTNDRLCELTAQDPNLKAHILKTLNENAAGMFLLAHLQILHLCGQSTVTDVRTSLDSLPTRVYDFYGEAIQRIEDQSENDRKTAKRALSYISCARRPLNVEELRHALGTGVGDTKLDRYNFPPTKILFNISAGLIRVDENNSTTTLVHYTLQEYLEKHPDKLLPESEMGLATACLTYLSFDVFRDGPCYDGELLEQRLHEYRFLDYASHHWGHHVIGAQLHERMGLLKVFLKDEAKVSSSVQVLNIPRHRMKGWYDNFPKQFSPLHVVAYWGLDKVLAVLSQEDIDINSQDSYGVTALQLAAQHGHTAGVRFLVEKGAEVDVRSNRGEAALSWAARNGHKVIVELLIVNGADVMMEDYEGMTALDWAVIGRYNEVVQVLLEQYLNVGSDNHGRNKALSLAAEAGNEKSVQMLLDNGAEINWKDDKGSTALTWAVPEGREKTVQLLLKNGADVKSRDIYDNTPLHWAIPHVTIARILVENRADINAKNNYGQTPLLWSAQDGQLAVLELLVQHNPDVNAQDKYGFTALHATALKGHESMARLLVENGADPNVKDDDGWTPLHAAALRQHEGISQLLLDVVPNATQILAWAASGRNDAKKRALFEHMAERKSEGSSAVTGLRWAVGEGRVERVQAILENGADIDAEDVGGWTALTIGAWMGQEATVHLLLENGADVNRLTRSGWSALHVASEYGYHGIVQLLVENGAEIDADLHGFTAMLLAAKNGHTRIMQYLVQKGADVNTEDYYDRRALVWAAKHGPPVGAQTLIDKGADINAADRWGRTALMWAIENRQSAVVDLLLRVGADVGLAAKDHSTALHLAAFVGEREVVHELLERGANIEAKTGDGFTALHMAAFMGHKAVLRLLLGRGADVEVQTQWPGAGDETEDEDYWQADENDWQADENDWEYVDDDSQDNEDAVYDGASDDNEDDGHHSGKIHRRALLLSKRLRQLLLEQEIVTDVEAEARDGLTVQQLAASSGNVTVQRLLARYCVGGSSKAVYRDT